MKRTSFLHIILLGFVSSLLLLCACHNTSTDKRLFLEAEILKDSIPLKALVKLKTINPQRLSHEDKIQYYRLRSELQVYSNNRSETDSLLNVAINFGRKSDSLLLSDVLFTKGKVLYNQVQLDSALNYFREAKATCPHAAPSSKRIQITQYEAFTEYYRGNFSKSKHLLQEVFQSSLSQADTLTSIYSLISLGTINFTQKNFDTAQEIFEKAHVLSTKIGDNDIKGDIYSQLSANYASDSNYQKALEYKKKERAARRQRHSIPQNNLYQAIVFDKINEPDSVRYYLDLAINGSDEIVAEIAYRKLSEWFAKQGFYTKAYRAWQNGERLYSYNKADIMNISLQQQYESAQLKNEINELKIKQKEKNILLLLIILSVVIASAVLFFYFWQQRKRRRVRELQIKTDKLEYDNLLLRQQKEISSLREKEALLRESLFRRISLFDKIPSLNTEEDNKSPSGQKVIKMTEEEWQELTRSVDDAFPGFTERLRKDYPSLTLEDIRFCCFIKINVNLQDLSDIYSVTKSAITKRKYRIKTNKLGITDNSIDLDTFLQEEY